MKIELREITLSELSESYVDNSEGGVVGYGGRLDIRPPYQREFVYKEQQRSAVIETVRKDFPLNVMYWAEREDGTYEVMDGQQRTISLCQYINGDFSIDGLAFHNLQNDQQQQILDYKLMVYFCSGTDSEKLEWFKTINIAGEKLTDQELLNAVYVGTWLADAKRYFSRSGCAAYGIASDYMTGSPIRQEYLETALEWISNKDIKGYMSLHQHDPNANEIWLYFQSVMNWVKATFPKHNRYMKGVAWGELYNQFKDNSYDADALAEEIDALMIDDDVSNQKGIYHYVLTRKEKYLNLRSFTSKQKIILYNRQEGICVHCKLHFAIEQMEADHITPWHLGGKTDDNNCQMLCKECNRRKSGK